MTRWLATLSLGAAVVYFIVPWDFDFIPVVGRLDDLIFLALAGYYYWRQPRGRGAQAWRRSAPADAPADTAPFGDQSDTDPYLLFGVSRTADAETVKKAYRDLIARYHPDRLHHLGEEFKGLAASKTTAINRAYERIKRERGFS